MVDYYETRAKNHLSQYLNLLVSKQEDEKKTSQKINYLDDNTAPNLIGIRKRKKFSNIGKMGVCLENILLVCPKYWLIFRNVVQFHEIFCENHLNSKIFCHSPLGWSSHQPGNIDKAKIPQEVAQHFIENLMHTFHNFKDYCADNTDASECTLLDDNDEILANAFKDYDKMFLEDDIAKYP